jgi:Protein of unknown function DUF262
MAPNSLSPIEIELEGIGHILRDRRLTVPPYQRGYAWGPEQIQDFWWDLRSAFGSSENQYFLGSIVLTPDSPGVSTIIDGQQRSATTALLFTALRNEFLRRGDENRARVIESEYLLTADLRTAEQVSRLRLNVEDQAGLMRAISSPKDPAQETEKPDRLTEALAFFEERVSEEARNAGSHWAETLFRWVDFLEMRARVIRVDVSEQADAFLIFETLNARGLELTTADLLKNYLFGLSRDRLVEMQGMWESALDSLETSADEEIFTTFVRHLWSSINGATRERELYGRMKAEITSPDAALAFGHRLKEAAPYYAALLSAEHSYWRDVEIGRAIPDTLLRFGLEQNRPLLLAAMLRFGPRELTRLLEAVIAWSTRGIIVGGIGGGTTERAYGEAAVAVMEGRATSAEDVYKELLPVIPTDEEFRSAFAFKRINRTRVAKYLLVALGALEARDDTPALVSEAEESAFDLRLVLPRSADPEEWPAFAPDLLRQEALRLGNQVATAPDGRSAPLEPPFDPNRWSPAALSRRQAEMAQLAVELWPRQP